MKSRIMNTSAVEYVFVGGGVASLCGIPAVLKRGVSGDQIKWIDRSGFRVGDFGSILSVGSSVPGNTSVEAYRKVNSGIYQVLPQCKPADPLTIDSLQASHVCSLKVAAEPMQYISDQLRTIIDAIQGSVTNINETSEGLRLTIELANGQTDYITTKRCVLATGAKPKTAMLPPSHTQIKNIDPNIVFIQTELKEYLHQHPGITTVAVIGSSHSAALAVMHLLQAGLTVKQFMNKEYKFATPVVDSDGTKYTKFDNTGLKGDVAGFTKKLLADFGIYKNKYYRYIGADLLETNKLMEQHLDGCSHAVSAIGYEASSTLNINNQLLSKFSYNKKTTEFTGIKGLFGLGIAFPQETKAKSGEVEFSVGYSKFWPTVNDPAVVAAWKNNVAGNESREQDNTSVRLRAKL